MASKREIERIRRVYENVYACGDPRWDEAVPGNAAIYAERRRAVERLLARHGFLPLEPRRVLEIGCGVGGVLAGLREFGAAAENLHGVDLVSEAIEEARNRHPHIHFQLANAEALEFPEAHFDLILLFTVFTSILDRRMRQNIAREIDRVLRPGGAVLWYDFRFDNPRNRNVRGIRRRDLARLFPGFVADAHSITLLPPLARRLGRWAPTLYPILSALPFLRTHLIGMLVKPAPSAQKLRPTA